MLSLLSGEGPATILQLRSKSCLQRCWGFLLSSISLSSSSSRAGAFRFEACGGGSIILLVCCCCSSATWPRHEIFLKNYQNDKFAHSSKIKQRWWAGRRGCGGVSLFLRLLHHHHPPAYSLLPPPPTPPSFSLHQLGWCWVPFNWSGVLSLSATTERTTLHLHLGGVGRQTSCRGGASGGGVLASRRCLLINKGAGALVPRGLGWEISSAGVVYCSTVGTVP